MPKTFAVHDSRPRFAGDRYQRLIQAAEVLSQDPAITTALAPFDGDGLLTFVASVAELRMLDDLSDRDADVVSMLLLFDFGRGPGQMAWRLQNWLSGDTVANRRGDNVWVIASIFAATLKLVSDALIIVDDTQD